MTSRMTRVALLAGLATFALGGTASAVECMTDDGYGRKRPCSASYKKEYPNWRASDACMTDDGKARKRPCSVEYKAKHRKK